MELDIMKRRVETEAQEYEIRYPQIFESVSEEFEARYGEKLPFTTFDKVALGRYLKTWESFLPIFEDDITTRDSLGEILKVGLDLVALQYATLPIQLLASVQPLTDEAGVVYYRKAVATITRGGVTAGDTLIGYMGKANQYISEYMSERLVNTSTKIGAGPSTGEYTFTLEAPVRRRSITVTVGKTKVTAIDDGDPNGSGTGHILGSYVNPNTSTINYTKGTLTLNFQNLDDNAGVVKDDPIEVTYDQDIARAASVPGFKYDVIARPIIARYFLLQSQYTSIANYVVKRRFGKSLAEDVARDTVAQVNGAVLFEAIKRLRTAAILNETTYSYSAPSWSEAPDPGVSDIDHRRTFTDLFEKAAAQIEDMSGRSSLSFLVIGQKARQIMSSIGFAMERKQVPGPYLAGYFEGLPVFYAPTSIIPANEVIAGFRGLMWYESPLVYAPFLPTTVVRASGNPNAFVEMTGVAHGAGIEAVVPEFVCRCLITS